MAILASVSTSQRQGLFQSPSWAIPLDATGYVRVVADISTADYEDTRNSATLKLTELVKGEWRTIMSSKWTGGRMAVSDIGVNPMPSIMTGLESLRGRTVRLEIEVQTRMRVGGSVETSPEPFY